MPNRVMGHDSGLAQSVRFCAYLMRQAETLYSGNFAAWVDCSVSQLIGALF